MERMDKLRSTLKFCIDNGKNAKPSDFNPELGNGAYNIYVDLYHKILSSNNLDEFMEKNNSKLKTFMDEFLKYVAENYQKSDKCKENIRCGKLHTLGEYVQDKLDGRFVKEVSKTPEMTREEHTINWFNANRNLDPERDSDIVQAAFITMFYID